MEFASYGYDVYTSEVDDHGIDFLVRTPVDDRYYEIQGKTVRNLDYVYIRKDKMALWTWRKKFLRSDLLPVSGPVFLNKIEKRKLYDGREKRDHIQRTDHASQRRQ